MSSWECCVWLFLFIYIFCCCSWIFFSLKVYLSCVKFSFIFICLYTKTGGWSSVFVVVCISIYFVCWCLNGWIFIYVDWWFSWMWKFCLNTCFLPPPTSNHSTNHSNWVLLLGSKICKALIFLALWEILWNFFQVAINRVNESTAYFK